MNRRSHVLRAGAIVLLCSGLAPLLAQQRPPESGRVATISSVSANPLSFSAKAEALAASGVVGDERGGLVVSHALYVKIRKDYIKVDAPATARALAERVGLPLASASPLAYTTTVPERSVMASRQEMSPERRIQAAAAEDDLARIVEIHYLSDISPAVAARRMMRNPEVEYAESIQLPQTLAPAGALPNDPMIPDEKQLVQTKTIQGWEIWEGDTNMVIAVVDAGMDNTHEDLEPNIKQNTGEHGLDANGIDRSINNLDDDGDGVIDDWKGANLTTDQDNSTGGDTRGSAHGTQVCGYAAAAANNGIGMAGIGNRCRFFPIKAAPRGSSFLSRGYEGIIFSAKKGFKVINLSWGGANYSQAEQDIISDVVAAYDVAIVAAGGNTHIYASRYPAGYRHVMGVAGVSVDEQLETTWGEQIDISSPAGLTTSDGNIYFTLDAATSYACPVVSGAMGLLRSKYPALSADQAIAHLRLTADNVDTLQAGDKIDSTRPYKEKLMGYGRLNVFRALSIDPFSHPAIEIDSVWLTAEDGTSHDGFRVGEHGMIRFRLKNLLGDASNIAAGIALYSSDSTVISIDRRAVSLASLASGSTAVPDGIPFTVTGTTRNRIRLRFDIASNNGAYQDYHYQQALVYRPYTVAATPKLKLSVSDDGNIGYADYPANLVGTGISYEDKSFLYEGGFIVASDSTHLVSNIRGENADLEQRDFITRETPSAANDSTLLLDDSGGDPSHRIGLELRLRTVTVDSIPDAVGVQLRARNKSGATIDSLRLAMFVDWDLADNDQDQTVTYTAAPGSRVPYYGRVSSLLGGYYVAHGVAAPARVPIFYAMQNDAPPTDIYVSFEHPKKWLVVSNGVGAESAGPADISLTVGKTLVGLQPGAEDTALFVIGISRNQARAAEAMRNLVGPQGTSSVGTSVERSENLLSEVEPNPFSQRTRFTVVAGGRGSALRVVDTYGRQVADLTSQLPSAPGATSVDFDASALPSGVYYLQLVSGPTVATRKLMLVR